MRKEINRLTAFDEELHCINVVIETPKGSGVKYAYDPKLGFFHLKKALPEGMTFPYNFGFIPATQGEDGDPLDVLILNEEPLFPGCLVKARLAGVMKAEQTEDGKKIRNDRLFAFALSKEAPTSLDTVEMNAKKLNEIEYFFKNYNKLEGKKFKALGKAGPKQAVQIVKKAEKHDPEEED
jgi:inorganic pyrophosphatase